MFSFFGVCWYEVIYCLWVQLASLGWSFPSTTFCGTGFVDRYCLNLDLSQNILFSPSMVIENFAGYSSLGLHPWSLSICRMSVQDLLAFKVSIEKLGVILIYLPLLSLFLCSY